MAPPVGPRAHASGPRVRLERAKNNPSEHGNCDPIPRMSRSATRYLEVRLEHVSLHRAGRSVLKDISWTIRPGERWVLAGANGAGETQLLKLVAGAVWPTPSTRAIRHYLLGRERSSTPAEVKAQIAYLGAERQDKYQRYGWNMAVERIVGTGFYSNPISLRCATPTRRGGLRDG